MMPHPQISIVVPLYNEAVVFDDLVARLNAIIEKDILTIEVILVDDGSSDDTPFFIKRICKINPHYRGIILSRNFGHQLALSAGLANVNCSEAVMIIDGDLQDPPELLFNFFEHYQQGYDVVYAIRKNRKESFIKKKAYSVFYRMQKRIIDIAIPLDAGDFSLISKRIVDVINNIPEESRFLRGLRSWVGYKQIGIEYDRGSREKGQTKYSWKKLFKLAFDGIFNFSTFPTKVIITLGFSSIIISLTYFAYILIVKIFYGSVPKGFTSLILALILFSGVQLLSLGIISEYIMRIFFQVKGRPLFIIKEKICAEQKEQHSL